MSTNVQDVRLSLENILALIDREKGSAAALVCKTGIDVKVYLKQAEGSILPNVLSGLTDIADGIKDLKHETKPQQLLAVAKILIGTGKLASLHENPALFPVMSFVSAFVSYVSEPSSNLNITAALEKPLEGFEEDKMTKNFWKVVKLFESSIHQVDSETSKDEWTNFLADVNFKLQSDTIKKSQSKSKDGINFAMMAIHYFKMYCFSSHLRLLILYKVILMHKLSAIQKAVESEKSQVIEKIEKEIKRSHESSIALLNILVKPAIETAVLCSVFKPSVNKALVAFISHYGLKLPTLSKPFPKKVWIYNNKSDRRAYIGDGFTMYTHEDAKVNKAKNKAIFVLILDEESSNDSLFVIKNIQLHEGLEQQQCIHVLGAQNTVGYKQCGGQHKIKILQLQDGKCLLSHEEKLNCFFRESSESGYQVVTVQQGKPCEEALWRIVDI